jgi:outer membrane protein
LYNALNWHRSMLYSFVLGGIASASRYLSTPDLVHHFMFGERVIMLRKFLYCLALGGVMSVNVQAADLKIGFVNVARLLEKAPQAERAKKELEREFSPRDKKLVAEQKEIKSLEEKLTKDSSILSESERDKIDKDILNRKREAKRAQDEFREDFNLRRNEELTQLQKEIFEAIQTLAKEESFDLLLTDGVVYAAEGIDVTSKVETKLVSGFKGAKKN